MWSHSLSIPPCRGSYMAGPDMVRAGWGVNIFRQHEQAKDAEQRLD